MITNAGTVLKCSGLSVTSIKIDPYLNIDAGTFNPYEHGEVFVLDDGGEVGFIVVSKDILILHYFFDLLISIHFI